MKKHIAIIRKLAEEQGREVQLNQTLLNECHKLARLEHMKTVCLIKKHNNYIL